MSLSENDKREVCPSCGWVGRKAFQRDRHDLCEAPVEDLPEEDDSSDEGPEKDDVDAVNASGDETFEEDDEDDEDDKDDDTLPTQSGRPSARQRGVPSKKTIALRRITQLELADGRAELKELGADGSYGRPKTRGDCQWCPVCQLVRDGKSSGSDKVALRAHDGKIAYSARPGRLACGHLPDEVIYHSRPCVFISCKAALYLDVSETGSIILNFPHLNPGEMPAEQSCALDLADKGPMTLEDIAAVTNLTRERIRQVELKALVRRARPAAVAMGLGPDDAAALGTRHNVGPGADLEETGIDGAVPSDILSGGGGEES